MVRVLNWNVRSLRDGPRAVAAVLAQQAVDLVVLQEAPRLLGWRVSRWLLAHRAGLRLLTRSAGCGNLLLGAPHVLRHDSGEHRLPRRPGLHRRAVVWAEVEVRGTRLLLAGTHLDLHEAERRDSAARVHRALTARAGGELPLVLGADVNDVSGSPTWDLLCRGLTDAGGPALGPTFPAWRPSRRIDGVFSTLPVRAARVVPTGRASDHLGLAVELDPRG